MTTQLAHARADEILAYIAAQVGTSIDEETYMRLKQRLVLTMLLNAEVKQDFINTCIDALQHAAHNNLDTVTALTLYGVVC
jgi:hypothetical protein